MDLEDVRDGVGFLKTYMCEVYQKVYDKLGKLKIYLNENRSDDDISIIC